MKISVIITVVNRKEFISNALRSLCEQTKPPYDVVVVSNIFLEDVFSQFNPVFKINLIYSDSLFQGENISKALKLCQGDVISFLEDDDEFEPKKIETVAKTFSSNNNLVLFRNDPSFINQSSGYIPDPTPNHRKLIAKKNSIHFSECKDKNIALFFRADAYFNLSTMSFRRGLLESIVMDMNRVWLGIDFILSYAALASGREILITSEKLTRYRVHEKHFSTSTEWKGYKMFANTFVISNRLAMRENKHAIFEDSIVTLLFLKVRLLNSIRYRKRKIYRNLFRNLLSHKKGLKLFFFSNPRFCAYNLMLLIKNMI